MIEDEIIETGADPGCTHGDEGRVRAEDAGAAERAAGVGSEPDVDAIDVEGVGAGREGAERVAVLEFEQAHGAVSDRKGFRFRFGEDGQREGFDGGVVEAEWGKRKVVVVGGRGRGWRGGDGDEEAAATATPPAEERAEEAGE